VSEAAELYLRAISLAKSFAANFIELAAQLRKLQELYPDRYQDFLKASGIGKRKAYYLVSIDKTFEKLPVPKLELSKLGWTKLTVLQPHATENNIQEIVTYAKAHTAEELKQYLKGKDAMSKERSILMYFSSDDYNKLVQTLVKHGAVKSGNALVHKEKALMKMVELCSTAA